MHGSFHGHSHGHAPDHGDDHAHPHDHNHPHEHDHLHSHVHGDSAREKQEELQVLATAFIEGYRQAKDKTSYLRLADIPFHRKGKDGLKMHLVDVTIASNWQIGTASPAFASRELVYLPYPGEMVEARESMTFTFVSLTEREDVDLLTFLKAKV